VIFFLAGGVWQLNFVAHDMVLKGLGLVEFHFYFTPV
jgi:hypothetical protein